MRKQFIHVIFYTRPPIKQLQASTTAINTQFSIQHTQTKHTRNTLTQQPIQLYQSTRTLRKRCAAGARTVEEHVLEQPLLLACDTAHLEDAGDFVE